MWTPARSSVIATGTKPLTETSKIWEQRRVAAVFRNLGCLYLPVTKAANTSIKTALIRADRALEGRGDADLPKDFNPHAWDAAEVVPWDAAYEFKGPRFTFVRNPFARLYSCFSNKVLPEPETRGTYVKGVHGSMRRFKGMRAGMSFADFVRVVARVPDADADIHFVSQCAFLVGPKGLRADLIGRVERQGEQWPEVERYLGHTMALPHLNVTGAPRYREHYDAKSRRLVEKRYAADFALLGYEF